MARRKGDAYRHLKIVPAVDGPTPLDDRVDEAPRQMR
jgi:hypothetical protein